MDRYLQILGWLCVGLGGAWMFYSGISLIVGVGIAMTVAGLALCLKAWGSSSVDNSSQPPAASVLPQPRAEEAVAEEVGLVGASLRLFQEQEETLRLERSVQQRIWSLTREVMAMEAVPQQGDVDRRHTVLAASPSESLSTARASRPAAGGFPRGRRVRHAR